MSEKVRVRIAPSPTGPLHIGTARTALFNYLFARQNSGAFVVRIEDTDKERSNPVFEENIFAGLKWLGFEADELYRQSERLEIYKEYAQKLTDKGLTYEEDGALIFKLQDSYPTIVVDDIIRGQVKFEAKDFDDIVLFKKDGMPTFHFANVVDDLTMEITHVIRGEDHLSNTPKHIMLFEGLGAKAPRYAHIPLILNEDRTKMSKRSGDTSLAEYINKGYLTEAVINFIVQLGWSPDAGSPKGAPSGEIFSFEELLAKFDLTRVQKGGAVFNVKHLNHLNHHYLMKKPLAEYIELAKPYLGAISTADSPANATLLQKALKLIQDRAQTLSEIPSLIDFFFALPDYPAQLLVFKKSSPDQTQKGLTTAFKVLTAYEGEWSEPKLKQILDEALSADGLMPGDIFWPIRVALSGNEASPSPTELLDALGKEESIKRLTLAISKLA